jgi:hypothetical protein
MEALMKLRLNILALLALALPLALFCAAGAADAPSFKPGAKVTLVLEVKAPPKWHLNSQVPLRVEFDKEKVKNLPVKLDKTTWDFTVVKDPASQSFELPISLTGKAKNGTLEIPAKLLCGYCNDEGCTFANEELKVSIVVKDKAPKDSKNQAQASGKISKTVTLQVPE